MVVLLGNADVALVPLRPKCRILSKNYVVFFPSLGLMYYSQTKVVQGLTLTKTIDNMYDIWIELSHISKERSFLFGNYNTKMTSVVQRTNAVAEMKVTHKRPQQRPSLHPPWSTVR